MADHDDEILFYVGLLSIVSFYNNIIYIIIRTDIKEQNHYDICKKLNINTEELNYKNDWYPFYGKKIK